MNKAFNDNTDELEARLIRLNDFLSQYPFPNTFKNLDEKIAYFKPIVDMGEWLWNDNYFAKTLRAFYHHYNLFFRHRQKIFSRV